MKMLNTIVINSKQESQFLIKTRLINKKQNVPNDTLKQNTLQDEYDITAPC